MSQTVPPAGAPEQSPLGKSSSYCTDYAPALLFPIDRAAKRAELGIGEVLPFVGEDLWNAYELVAESSRQACRRAGELSRRGGVAAAGRVEIAKLYLNSFNGTRFADAGAVRATIARDLSTATGAPVAVSVSTLDTRPARALAYAEGELIDDLDIEIADYRLRPDVLRIDEARASVSETLVSQLLKSNCLVTGQPDWGTVVIRYSGKPIDRESLLRYIVSFRNHDEFHEQCVERIFTDLRRYCAPQRLAVWARYTRRGGLDINPSAATGRVAARELRRHPPVACSAAAQCSERSRWLIRLRSSSAVPRNWRAASPMRPTLALFDSTEPEITSIAVATSCEAAACWSSICRTSLDRPLVRMLAARICSRLALLSPICRVPALTRSVADCMVLTALADSAAMPVTAPLMSAVEAAVRSASLRTSSATTAKPRPARRRTRPRSPH